MTDATVHNAAPKAVFLIGFPGSGKTTLGRALEGRCDPQGRRLRFIDLDEYIEQSQQRSISDIFAQQGEQGFRDIERQSLVDLARETDTGTDTRTIIACGGGTPCFFDNMHILNSLGITVWLKPSPEALLRRLKAGRQQRPLLRNLDDQQLRQYIADTSAQRDPFYALAAHTFDSDLLESPDQINRSVITFINNILS